MLSAVIARHRVGARAARAARQIEKREPSLAVKIISSQPGENNHGTKIFQESFRQRRTRDEGT
jgi:hypothetical protein